jgi:hypothetical protein
VRLPPSSTSNETFTSMIDCCVPRTRRCYMTPAVLGWCKTNFHHFTSTDVASRQNTTRLAERFGTTTTPTCSSGP